jgi:hypothetical protein
MIDVCVGGPAATPQDSGSTDGAASPKSAGPSYLSFMALNRGTAVADAPGSTTPTTARTAVEESTPSGSGATTPAQAPPPAPKPPVRRPSPRVFFAHFVAHRERFVRFLEAVATRRWGQSLEPGSATPSPAPVDAEQDRADQAAVWNTLLELYLDTDGDKALRTLQRGELPYERTHALILCAARAFTPGLVLLWERAGMHEAALRHWMDRARAGTPGASVEVVRALRTYGGGAPALYPLVLRFLTSTPALLAAHRADVEEVLEHIEREKIMSPVAVVQALGRNGVASVGLVKAWLMTRIREAREEIATVCRRFLFVVTAC